MITVQYWRFLPTVLLFSHFERSENLADLLFQVTDYRGKWRQRIKTNLESNFFLTIGHEKRFADSDILLLIFEQIVWTIFLNIISEFVSYQYFVQIFFCPLHYDSSFWSKMSNSFLKTPANIFSKVFWPY